MRVRDRDRGLVHTDSRCAGPESRVHLSGSTLLASLVVPTPTPVLTYNHTDMLGSVRVVTNTSGGVVLPHEFGAFGEGGSMQGDPRQFTGQERDSETALDHFRARAIFGRCGDRSRRPTTRRS